MNSLKIAYDTRGKIQISAKSGSIDSSLNAQFNRTSLAASDADRRRHGGLYFAPRMILRMLSKLRNSSIII